MWHELRLADESTTATAVVCGSFRAGIGVRSDAASIAPSAAPASGPARAGVNRPIGVCQAGDFGVWFLAVNARVGGNSLLLSILPTDATMPPLRPDTSGRVTVAVTDAGCDTAASAAGAAGTVGAHTAGLRCCL